MNPREESRPPHRDVNQERVMRLKAESYPGRTQYMVEPPSATRVVTTSALSVVAALAAGVLINSDEEAKSGGENALTQLKQVEALKNLAQREKSEGSFIEAVREASCSALDDISLTHTLYKSTPEGPNQFNMYTFLIPLQLHFDRACIAKIKVGVRIPYIFAKTFTEIQQKNAPVTDEILKQFAEVLKAQLRGEEIIRGIPEWTNFRELYDAALKTKRVGSTDLSEKSVRITYAKGEGAASDEANIGERAGARSLGMPNPENEKLAADRLKEILEKFPLIMEATGIPRNQVFQITNVMTKDSKEVVLAQQQIAQLAELASRVGARQFAASATMQEKAFFLLEQHNAGNQAVLAYLEKNPTDAKIFTDLILSARAVTLQFELTTDYKSREVYTIPIPLPLLLLLLIPSVRRESIPPLYIPARTYRRIFIGEKRESNTEPPTFDEIYDSLPTNPYSSSQTISDLAEITKMFIVDEVAPSLERDDHDRSPYAGFERLRYDGLLSSALSNYRSALRNGTADRDSLRATLLKTMTKELVTMWQENDRIFTYGDGDQYLHVPYEQSETIVMQAKAVADYFMYRIDEEIAQAHPSSERLTQDIRQEANSLVDAGEASRTKLLMRR